MSTGRSITKINLGGEGEAPKIINQQRPAALSSRWGSCVRGDTLEDLAKQGHDFLICPNLSLPIDDEPIDFVVTDNVLIDSVMFGEPTIQSSEILRILATKGRWQHNGIIRHIKP